MNCPFPRYYFCHAVLALVIAIVVGVPIGLEAGLAAGTAFYAGREYTQWESGLPFDWRGIAAPAIACLAFFVVHSFVW